MSYSSAGSRRTSGFISTSLRSSNDPRRYSRGSIMNCPNCNKWITWLQKWRFAAALGIIRKASPCPNCGVNLIWAKWPYRIMWTGIGFMLLAALVSHYADSGSDDPRWMVCVLAAIAMQLVGVFLLKFQIVGESNKNVEI